MNSPTLGISHTHTAQWGWCLIWAAPIPNFVAIGHHNRLATTLIMSCHNCTYFTSGLKLLSVAATLSVQTGLSTLNSILVHRNWRPDFRQLQFHSISVVPQLNTYTTLSSSCSKDWRDFAKDLSLQDVQPPRYSKRSGSVVLHAMGLETCFYVFNSS